ncbi:head-tail connector protein [Rhodopseudomonas parapalustris]
MILSLAEAKQYLRIELSYTDEDTDITALISAAEGYLKNAGCVLNIGDEVAKLAIKMLVVHWYENRDSVLIGSISKSMEYSLQSIVTQLKYCYPIVEGGS